MGLKICAKCGKRYNELEKCSCQEGKDERNKYQRDYYERNKDQVRILTGARWRKLRTQIMRRDKGYCQRCFCKYNTINTEDLQVHHIKPRTKYPELIYEPTNLITICGTCNKQLGVSEELDFEFNQDMELERKL